MVPATGKLLNEKGEGGLLSEKDKNRSTGGSYDAVLQNDKLFM